MKAILTILIMFFSQILYAGRYAGDFMAIGSGVKALALGGAFSAIADDGSAIYWNASGIAQIKKTEAAVMRAFLYNGLAYYDNFSFCLPLQNNATVGANWIRLTIDDIPIYDEKHLIGTNIDQRTAFAELHLSAIPDGKFKSTDDMYQLAFAKQFTQIIDLGWDLFELPIDIYLGGVCKFINRKMLDFKGSGMGFDLSFMLNTNLGLLFDTEKIGNIACSVNFQDIGNTKITWNTETRHSDDILFNTKFGIAYYQSLDALYSNLILSYSKDHIYDKTDYFGLAWNFKDITEFRLGTYDKNFSAGAGVFIHGFNIDYAFLTNNLGNTNRIGLGYTF